MKNLTRLARAMPCTVLAMLGLGCGGGDGDGDSSNPNTPPSSITSSPVLLQVAEDTILSAQLSASDADGDSLAYAVTAAPTHGTLVVTSTGAATYTPASNYNGSDAFVATVSDGHGGSLAATFNVTVTAVNDPPAISGTSLAFTEDAQSTAAVAVTDPEGDPFDIEALTGPGHGTLINVSSNGEITYLPAADFNGQDSLTLRAIDSHGLASAASTITLNVAPVNDPPLSADDSQLVPSGANSTIDVRANDTDIEGDALTVTIVTPPTTGTASVVSNQISYTPAAGYMGPASLVYQVSDTSGATSYANLRLVVGAFQQVLFIEGDAKTKLYHFDGFTTTALNPRADYQTHDFRFSGDGKFVVYNQRSTQNNGGTLYFHDFAQAPDSRVELPAASPSSAGLSYAINHAGTWVFYTSRESPSSSFLRSRLIRLSDLATSDVIPGPFTSLWPNSGVFNPVTDEFYFQARFSVGTPPVENSQAFDTLFRGSIAVPAPLKIGANYPVDNGSGSGFDIRVTPDGHNVLHVALDNTTQVASLLVNNRVTNTETDLYRAFTPGEFPTPNEYDMNAAGSSVCFRLNTAGAGSAGPGQVWVASPVTPGTATAITPLADVNSDCRFASDGNTIAYLTANGAQQPEVYLVDRSVPNVITRMREPLAAGESTEFFLVARGAMTGVVGVNPGSGAAPQLYRVDLGSPGTSVRFGSPGTTGANPQYRLSDDGNWLAYLKDEPAPGGSGTVKRLHLLSTLSTDFDLALGSGGVSSYGFRPTP
jgi:hypothetical protein